MSRHAPLFDRAAALAFFDVPSAYFVAHPRGWLAKKVVGPHSVRWHAVHTHADEVPEWVRRGPDKDAGLFPATYTQGALLAVPHGEIGRVAAALEREHGGVAVPAAAFRVGKALVAAEIPRHDGDQPTPPDAVPGHRAAILGIGDRVCGLRWAHYMSKLVSSWVLLW